MAMIDKLLEVSDAQAITASAASTNYIDLGSARQIAAADEVYLTISVDVTAVGNGAAPETYQFDIQTDTVNTFATPTSLATKSPATATLTAGAAFSMLVPPGGVEEFLRLYVTTAGTAPSITISAYFTTEPPQGNVSYPAAI